MTDRILVTGLSGLIGQALQPSLSQYSSVVALNRRPVQGLNTHQADISDYEAIRPAFDDIDVVVHLAAKAGDKFSWDELHDTNVVGTYNVLKAAADAGCSRLVFASSGATVSGYESVEPYRTLVSSDYSTAPGSWPLIDHQSETRPSGIYAATKIWGEAICRHFSNVTDLTALCVRIGYVNGADRPSRPRDWAVWCSQRDIVSALTNSIDYSGESKCETFFATSRNKWGYRDLSHARSVIGYDPKDEAESYR